MFEKLEVTRMAQALMAHSGARLAVAAQNVAHADTPGYRARDVPDFAATYADPSAMRATRPGHLGRAGDDIATPRMVPGMVDPNGNSVSLEEEMMRAASARQGHEMALAIYRSVSAVTRAALGRGGA